MDREYIYIFKGDDTNWNNEQFVTVNVTSQTGVDLSGMTAKFKLGSHTAEYPLTTGSFTIDLSSDITGQYAFGPICGTIQILDEQKRIKTACNTIPFYITDKVIAEQHQTLDIDLPQGSPVSINLSVGGTGSYNDLTDKPSLNGVTIEGAKTSSQYGLANASDIADLQEQIDGKQPVGDYATQADLSQGLATKQDVIADLSQIRSNAELGATAVQPGALDTALATKASNADGSTIVDNGTTISTVAVKEQNANLAIKKWVGTKAEYDAIAIKDANTTYIVTDEDDSEMFVIDSSLSGTSTNAVQNRVIYTALQGKQDVLPAGTTGHFLQKTASGVEWAEVQSGGGAPTLTWYTGNTGTSVTIADTSNVTLVKVYKNGILLEPTADYSISGTTLTLVSALVSTDKITTEIFA